jgi:L-threonylcarbamoyladenylate synthase
LTILLPKKSVIPDLVTSGLPQVAVRMPNHALTLDLLRGLSFPLAAPSANPFGYISPTTAAHVAAQLGDKIPYILDGGDSLVGVESTIIGFDNNKTVVYRLGGLPIEVLEKVVGKVHTQLNQSSNPTAPGMLKSHYAPRKPLYLSNIADFLHKNTSITEGVTRIGILSFKNDFTYDKRVVAQEILSKSGDTGEAAQRLFAALRRLDASDADVIVAETVPPQGLGLAINDRLHRASVHD